MPNMGANRGAVEIATDRRRYYYQSHDICNLDSLTL